jgi:hypothetical protein
MGKSSTALLAMDVHGDSIEVAIADAKGAAFRSRRRQGGGAGSRT